MSDAFHDKLNDLIDERFIINQYRTLNSQHVRKLKIDVKIYIRAVEAFLRARRKQDLRHRLVFAEKIDNLQLEITQILMSSMNNLIDTIKAHLSMQALFLKKTQRSHDRSTRKKLSRSFLDLSDERDETKKSEKKDEEKSSDSNDDDDEKEMMQSSSRTRKRARA
jgi:hypothetical protein